MIRRHWPFALVLTAGAVLRVACEIAYRPALFYSDSWGYLSMAHAGSLVGLAPLRPSGYPILLKILHWLTLTTLVQHLAGLAVATLVYAICTELGVRRWLATVGGALVALDAWAIALEQYILAEAFFGLALVLVVWASIGVTRADAAELTGRRIRGSASVALGFAGLCLAAAILMRPVGFAAVPAWVIWMLWVRPGARPIVTGLACLVVPLVLYAAVHASVVGTFGLTQANGWFLYGRVGPIATCNGIKVAANARKLCNRPPEAAHENQSFFMFNKRSPARVAFVGISSDPHVQAYSNGILGHFARQVIEERPGAFAKLIFTDFFKYMRPGPHALHHEDQTVMFPTHPHIPHRFDDRAIRHRLFPGLKTHASPPASALRSYASVFHTSRPLIALMTLVSLLALALGRWTRDPRLPAIFLALGVGLGVLFGAALGAGFALRYLVPLVAEFVIAASLAVESLATALRRRS